MSTLTLYIGNKNYSSWSLRGWLLLRAFDIPFTERKLSLSADQFSQAIHAVSPAGRVPVLIDDDLVIWDTLAIAEYLAETFPRKHLWPRSRAARARARSICAEMHSGFSHLRSHMPMNIEADLKGMGWNLQVQSDIDRIVAMWSELLREHGGPFLFGEFSAADAFYAPVVSRFQTHGVVLPPACNRYAKAVRAHPAMKEWSRAARAEKTFLPEDEPYRRAPPG